MGQECEHEKAIETLIEFLRLLREIMPQSIQIFVSLTINPPAPPPPPPLTESPASSAANPIALPAETVGVAVPSTQITQLQGGTPPYGQPVVDPASPNPLPPGLVFATDAQGNVTVSGVPTNAGSGPFTLVVSDSGA
jgi:hypothetical protein